MLSHGRSPRRTPCRNRARLSLPHKHSIGALLASSRRSRVRRTAITATSPSKHIRVYVVYSAMVDNRCGLIILASRLFLFVLL